MFTPLDSRNNKSYNGAEINGVDLIYFGWVSLMVVGIKAHVGASG